jgi:deazaflavin-dependent oxidoreductase (nitroreductase family)
MAGTAARRFCPKPSRSDEARVAAKEPLAARLHFIARDFGRLQAAAVRRFRHYFERAPGWVILTTRGRKTGLPREVLLPCERSADFVIVISTFHWRSDWIRNLRRNPDVTVTCAGWAVPARAEIVEDSERKRAIITAHLFFPTAPFLPVHAVLRTILRPLLLLWMRKWVAPRPMVLIRPLGA